MAPGKFLFLCRRTCSNSSRLHKEPLQFSVPLRPSLTATKPKMNIRLQIGVEKDNYDSVNVSVSLTPIKAKMNIRLQFGVACVAWYDVYP